MSDPVTLRLSVPEMDCPSCAGKVENALERCDDVTEFDARPMTGQVVVTAADADRVVAAIEAAGYGVADAAGSNEHAGGSDATADGDEAVDDSPHSVWTSARGYRTWAGAVLLVAGLALKLVALDWNPAVATVLNRQFLLSQVLFVTAAAVAGGPVVRGGYYSLRQRNLDMDLLMSAGIVAALAVHLPFEAATLAVLFSVAELLETFSMDRARRSLRELMDLSPDTATVLREGEGTADEADDAEVTVPVEAVEVGETVVVRPGERVPMDGVVTAGASAVDQAPITGESVPVDKEPGEEVYAGTINGEGYLELEVTAPASETTLSRIVRLVEDAQADRTDREQFVDRFASYYTPVVVAGALLTAAVPPLVLAEPWRPWFLRGLTLLVIACPCAFVISTPVSVVSGITSAARNGVLIKGGNHLEAMGDVDALALDKTGTLTRGELSVTDVVPLGGRSEASVLACARDIERRSEHPISTAIVEHTADREDVPDERPIANFESLIGRGVRADVDGTTHYAGNPALFDDLGFDLDGIRVATDGGRAVGDAVADDAPADDTLAAVVPRFQAAGKTIVLVGTDEEIEGLIAIADEIRPDAPRAVERLRESSLETVMLTGDNEGTARAIAEQVGVDDHRAELLPEQKVAAVERLQKEHGTVAMVGDGINDAPALATADVGVAMGSAGTDTAIETADVALMGDDVAKLPYLVELSRSGTAVIRQNVWSSLGVKALLALGAPFGYVPVWLAIVVGDMGMSLGVTGNAMRLARIEPDEE